MKVNEAPEKIYIHKSQYWGLMANEHNITKNGVEYIRTDAFIEKTAQWLKENLLNHTYVYEGEVGIGMDVFLEEFKKAMRL